MAQFAGLVALVLVASLGCVWSLKCYECSSLLEPQCGVEWTFAGGEGQKYLVECAPTATACDKIVGDWQGSGDQHVYRTCFNQTIESFTPSGCGDEDVRGSIYCHCTTDGCNGGPQRAAPGWWTLAVACSVAVVLLKLTTAKL